jgi:hypothetical protein
MAKLAGDDVWSIWGRGGLHWALQGADILKPHASAKEWSLGIDLVGASGCGHDALFPGRAAAGIEQPPTDCAILS